MAATPAVALTDATDVGAAVASVAVALALWAGGLATFVATDALPPFVLTSRRSTRDIVFRAALPGVLVSLVAALAVSLILLPLLHLSVGRWFFLAAATALAAVTFALLNQTMVALAHRVGRFGSTAVLVLAVVTSLTSTIPPTLHTIGGFLPTHAAVLALRGIITGSATAATGIGHLAVWLLVSALATVAVTEHRRTLSGRQLRLVRRPRLT